MQQGARRAAMGAVVIAVVAATGRARAQAVEPKNFPVERFVLASDRDGLLGVEWAGVRPMRTWEVSAWLGGEDDPLVIYQNTPHGRAQVGALVGSRIGGAIGASYAPLTWLAIAIRLPVILDQQRDATGPALTEPLPALTAFGVGDLAIIPKVRLLAQPDQPIELALVATLTVPTGGSDQYRGEPGVGFEPGVAIARREGALRLAGNLAWRMRGRTQLLDQVVDDELIARVGLGLIVHVGDRPVELAATLSAAVAAAHPFQTFNQNHLEAIVGPSAQLGGRAQVFAGAGVGLAPGFGTPDWRVLAGVRLGEVADHGDRSDRDHDGILDRADRCPDEAEDRDGFEDQDGCPDLDDDADGVPDALDGAPRDPEDRDGFEDQDGVPDPDDDHDGIPDRADKCPRAAEVVNGVDDQDGCPDVADRDGDGVADDRDACPDEPEDLDGVDDQDGCPDLDDDHDDVADLVDRCPREAGPVDNQGCPDPDRDGDSVVDRLDNCPDQAGTAANHGCKDKQLVVLAGSELQILDAVYFKLDKAIIEKRSFKLLDNVARVLAAHPEITSVEIGGHTDSQGDDAYNLDLSRRRAEAVRIYVIDRGIPADRLTAKGYGETQPIADNATAIGRAANRRVVFTVIRTP
jgi:outer membrane protein OmpA-like peptidoglycan-associated protein